MGRLRGRRAWLHVCAGLRVRARRCEGGVRGTMMQTRALAAQHAVLQLHGAATGQRTHHPNG
jgi:hypothetical protein